MSLLHRKKSLFQRLMLLGLMALVLSTSLVFTVGVTSAKTAFAESCYDNAQTLASHDAALPAIFGMTAIIRLRFSTVCNYEWAQVVLSKPLDPGYDVNAILTRNVNVQQIDCAGGSGNGVITYNQTSCYSGNLWSGPGTPYTGYATALYHVIGHPWIAFEHTTSA